MSDARGLARFITELWSEGLLDQLLGEMPPEEVAGALSGVARENGIDVCPKTFGRFLGGLDARLT